MIPFLMSLAGMLLCNSIPHLAAGLQGRRFPTPFAKPRGVGLSPALLNFLWGTGNLAAGVALTLWRLPVAGVLRGSLGMLAGFILIGVYLSTHFARAREQQGSVP